MNAGDNFENVINDPPFFLDQGSNLNLEKYDPILNLENKNVQKTTKTGSKVLIRRKKMLWKSKASVCTEGSEKIFDPISKRLFSLVNSNGSKEKEENDKNCSFFLDKSKKINDPTFGDKNQLKFAKKCYYGKYQNKNLNNKNKHSLKQKRKKYDKLTEKSELVKISLTNMENEENQNILTNLIKLCKNSTNLERKKERTSVKDELNGKRRVEENEAEGSRSLRVNETYNIKNEHSVERINYLKNYSSKEEVNDKDALPKNSILKLNFIINKLKKNKVKNKSSTSIDVTEFDQPGTKNEFEEEFPNNSDRNLEDALGKKKLQKTTEVEKNKKKVFPGKYKIPLKQTEQKQKESPNININAKTPDIRSHKKENESECCSLEKTYIIENEMSPERRPGSGSKLNFIFAKLSRNKRAQNETDGKRKKVKGDNFLSYDSKKPSNSKLVKEVVENDHEKLRGFFRQISVEKCGLSIMENGDIFDFTNEKSLKNPNNSTEKWNSKEKTKTENETEVTEKESEEFIISSNEDLSPERMKNGDEKVNDTFEEEEDEELVEKDYTPKNYISTYSILSKLTNKNERQKSNNNNINVQDPSFGSDQQINVSNSEIKKVKDKELGDMGAYTNDSEEFFYPNKSRERKVYTNESSLNSHNSYESFVENVSLPIKSNCFNEKKKMNFTKRLFKQFLRFDNSYEMKKKCFLETSTVLVSEITVDYIINLIAIFSVELLLGSMEIVRDKRSEETSEFKVGSEVIATDDDILGKGDTESEERLPQNQDLPKMPTLSFDINGRLVGTHSMIQAFNKPNFIKRKSWTNLYNTHLQTSSKELYNSTYSFKSRYNLDGSMYKPSKIAFNSRVQEPLIYKPNSLSKVRTKQTNVRTEVSYKSFAKNSANSTLSERSHPSIFNSNVSESRHRKVQPEKLENGNYRISIPIESSLDFAQINELFLLKDHLNDLGKKCAIFVQPIDESHHLNKMFNRMNVVVDSWCLQIECPTSTDLIRSVQLTASTFPKWNLGLHVQDELLA